MNAKRAKAHKNTITKLFVLDTNVLMHDPMSLFRFEEHDIYVPMMTLEELDANKKGMSEVARNARQEQEADALKPLVERLAKALGDKVKEVRVTFRLTDSPACLVVGEGEVSGNLERLLKSVGQKAPTVVPILEVNPHHPLVQRLAGETDERLAEWAALLFDQALLAEGGHLDDPAGFVRRVNALMLRLAG